MKILLVVFASLFAGLVQGLSESDRVTEYDARYPRSWPPKDYVPNTEGWRRVHEHRFDQIREMSLDDGRYEGYMQSVFAAFLVQNFTQYGFGLARAPQGLTEALREGITGGLERGEARLEYDVDVIEGPRCLFIDRPDLTARTLKELQSYTEAWAGMELTPHIAYGFRLYQNNSVLNMHVDKKQTHIISMILHIWSSEDSEPWPIYIEDLNGNTHEVILAPGDILFYESSKCLHGRPKMFNGGLYSSVFIHFYPKYGYQDEDHQARAHYIVPPGWADDMQEGQKKEEALKMVGTSFKEPGCPNGWCGTQNTIKWSGPGEDGFWIDPTGGKHPFTPKRYSSDEL